ncbi:MAG: OmpH family outer membrane protein [Planctomycetes bacterium]|nr:OmpH family outer membrane protein [Planctomycetota bacterium]
MRARTGLILSAAIVLAGAAASRPSPPAVAVVDLSTLFETYPGRGAMESVLSMEKSQLEEEIDRRKKEIEKMREELASLDPLTAAYRQRQEEFVQAQRGLEFRAETGTRDLQQKRTAFRNRIVREIEEAVERFGRERGYDLILQREWTLSREELSWKSVLFASPTVDVTEAVASAMIDETERKAREAKGGR